MAVCKFNVLYASYTHGNGLSNLRFLKSLIGHFVQKPLGSGQQICRPSDLTHNLAAAALGSGLIDSGGGGGGGGAARANCRRCF